MISNSMKIQSKIKPKKMNLHKSLIIFSQLYLLIKKKKKLNQKYVKLEFMTAKEPKTKNEDKKIFFFFFIYQE
jgi:hypothetical protein